MPYQFQSPVIVQTADGSFPKANISVPYISGGPSKEADTAINKSVLAHVQDLVNSQGPLDDPRAEMIGYYELKNNQKDILSLSLFNYAYTGGAHGLTLQLSLTFKQSTGQSYKLQDLFKPDSDYMAAINKIISAQIKARKLEPIEPFDTIRTDQDFYIADRSLVVYFQLYELMPYVYGFSYFPISVYELVNVINSDGPLGPMLENN